MHKNVKYLIPAFDINMGGTILKQALPTQKVEMVDPFLLLHHGTFNFNPDAPAIQQGIGPHPHRGFSPVTFIIDGELQHRDSRGNNQIAKKGEVQWMHAGAGIIHSERPSQNLIEKKGSQEIIQIWINSPANRKMEQPSYQYVPRVELPYFSSTDSKMVSRLIAGSYNDLSSKMQTMSELKILWSEGTQTAKETFDIPLSYNCVLYLIRGQIKISNYGLVEEKTLVVFENNDTAITVEALDDVQFIILAGEPIQEKVVQQGPFVMNSETEILQAMRDYQMGKMGVLIEDR
jgi:redox-sensitive bicupin YhaK (pirin superfamily)